MNDNKISGYMFKIAILLGKIKATNDIILKEQSLEKVKKLAESNYDSINRICEILGDYDDDKKSNTNR